jgi:hypothetical protein
MGNPFFRCLILVYAVFKKTAKKAPQRDHIKQHLPLIATPSIRESFAILTPPVVVASKICKKVIRSLFTRYCLDFLPKKHKKTAPFFRSCGNNSNTGAPDFS